LNKIFAITPVNQDPFIVTWDLGRRCNYDCSYCPAHRHDNFSSHASLEQLKATTTFLFDYILLVSQHRKNKDFHVSFTGGEPTVNPVFIDFAKYIRKEYDDTYKNTFNLKLSLTTNGAMSEKTAQAVIENFDYVTVSYHAEAKDSVKASVIDRINFFNSSEIAVKVNVMFHADYFDECKTVCERLSAWNIKFIPRLIGDDPDSKSSQAHLYTDDHKQWLKQNWNIDITPTSRPCCGGREFGVCSTAGQETAKAVVDRQFKDWHCSVNWYFLHIEQQTGLVYHHQTCQATLESKRGSIGTLMESDTIVETLRNHLINKTMPVITCPNNLCGCGLCTPKSSDREKLMSSMDDVLISTEIFHNV
jgi:MoaA/NifB/PqqE/SkfB family radical SAM enzyme